MEINDEVLQSHILTEFLGFHNKLDGYLTIPPLLHIRNKTKLVKMIKRIHREVKYGPAFAELNMNLVEMRNGLIYSIKWTDADKLCNNHDIIEVFGSSFPEFYTDKTYDRTKGKEYSLLLSTNPNIGIFTTALEMDGVNMDAMPDLINGSIAIKANMSKSDVMMTLCGNSLFFLRSLGRWDCKEDSGVLRYKDYLAWLFDTRNILLEEI